jgi:hypothetical protein
MRKIINPLLVYHPPVVREREKIWLQEWMELYKEAHDLLLGGKKYTDAEDAVGWGVIHPYWNTFNFFDYKQQTHTRLYFETLFRIYAYSLVDDDVAKKFSSGVELWESGVIPTIYDLKIWKLHCACRNWDVLYELYNGREETIYSAGNIYLAR